MRLPCRNPPKGTRYLTGRLAYGKLVAFQGQPTEDGTPTWDVYLTPGDQQQGRRAPTAGLPARAEASGSGSYRPAAQQRSPARRHPAPAGADDEPPPFDDPLPF